MASNLASKSCSGRDTMAWHFLLVSAGLLSGLWEAPLTNRYLWVLPVKGLRPLQHLKDDHAKGVGVAGHCGVITAQQLRRFPALLSI